MENLIIIILFACSIVLFMLYYFKRKEVITARSEGNSYSENIALLQEKGNSYSKTIAFLQEKINSLHTEVSTLAREQFDEFKKKEIDDLRDILAKSAEQSALAELEKWKVKNEAYYRQDAINRSQSVILGKVTEHLIPFQSAFPFNPKEARFIGSPIDIIVFDGIDNEDIVDIYILEIKTGNSSLSKRQKLVRDAVMNKRVHWREINI